jgi:tRNA-splicing endonuclease subunit Sen2
MNGVSKVAALDVPTSTPLAKAMENGSSDNGDEIINKEHLQLTPEEAFFLSFGVGALAVTDPLSGQTLSNQELLRTFRQHSYFPPRDGPDDPDLQPDDDFLIQYAVYHHFRSMGWVPRAGIKFGVDWLLYARGPVFDHAEFGLIVIPCYSDLWWASSGKQALRKSWSWLHSIVRVLSHVTKSLVLIYVDVPSPPAFSSAMEKGFAEALKQYEVREVMVKRWSSNRNRGSSKPKGK